MTAASLVADLRRRGVRIEPDGGNLRVRPADRLTEADLEALRAHKAAVLALLAKPPAPEGPCGLCSTSAWRWAPDWPPAGAWLCGTCAETPRPSLAEVHASLTAHDRARLDVEAADGDPLAATVLEVLAQPASDTQPQFHHAGVPCAWLLYSARLEREFWVARDADAAATLPADRLPVLLAEELPRLRGLDDGTLRAVLDGKATFPGARVVEREAGR